MSKNSLLEKIEKKQMKTDIPYFSVGDTVKVSILIIEGSKERVQTYQGTVIARDGSGIGETFTVHRVAYGGGMTRVFPLHSPRVSKIELVREGDVRSAKLYRLVGTSGKASKVKARIGVSRAAKHKENAEVILEEVETVAETQEETVIVETAAAAEIVAEEAAPAAEAEQSEEADK